MPAEKMSFSFEPRVAETLRRRAEEQGKPASRYLADLVERDARQARDELAAVGYREFAAEQLAFAEDALAIASEDWIEQESIHACPEG
jgi:hypothetical protein